MIILHLKQTISHEYNKKHVLIIIIWENILEIIKYYSILLGHKLNR